MCVKRYSKLIGDYTVIFNVLDKEKFVGELYFKNEREQISFDYSFSEDDLYKLENNIDDFILLLKGIFFNLIPNCDIPQKTKKYIKFFRVISNFKGVV